MADYKKYNTDGRSSEDRALDKFAEMMIEKINTLQNDWKKPWFTEGSLTWPKNLSGREYNGMNALMLMMHCEKQGYLNSATLLIVSGHCGQNRPECDFSCSNWLFAIS